MTVLLIDHFDSFSENLARYVRLNGATCQIAAYDNLPEKVTATHIILSPGPKSPQQYPKTIKLLQNYYDKIPILGVCLGHQLIGECFNGKISRAENPRHGLGVSIKHNSKGLFKGLKQSIIVGCYNSLILKETAELEVSAVTEIGEVMAIRHKSLPIFGVQFHPESIITEHGALMLKNFLEI